jgi:hypothetical protein
MLVASLALAGPAVAAATPLIHATPASVARGHKVRLHGTIRGCPKGDQVTLLSKAFKGSGLSFAGVPAVFAVVGRHHHYSVVYRIRKKVTKKTYSLRGRCGGGNFGHGSLTVT